MDKEDVVCIYMCVLSHSVVSDCDPMDYSLLGSSVHGILQARILEWVAISFSRDLPDTGIESALLAPLALVDGFFTTVPPGKPIFNVCVCSTVHIKYTVVKYSKEN